MAFTGQVLRFDQDAYWGLGDRCRDGRKSAVDGTSDRSHDAWRANHRRSDTFAIFTLHVFVIPGTIIAIVSLHLRLVLAKGINEYPVPGKLVEKATYVEEYGSTTKERWCAVLSRKPLVRI